MKNTPQSAEERSEELDRRLAALPRETTPSAEVFSRISNEINSPHVTTTEAATAATTAAAGRSSTFGYLAAGLGFAAVVALAAVWGLSNNAPIPAGPAEPEGFAEVKSFAVEGLDSAQVTRVRNELHTSLRLALDELSPKTRATVVENLSRIDAARAEIDLALKSDPANQLLKQMLLASYTNEIAMLNEFTRMAQSAPQRTQL